MSNPFNKNRARKSFKLNDIETLPEFTDFVEHYKPFGVRREREFIQALIRLCQQVVSLGYDEGVATKAEFGARRLGSRGGEKGGPARARKLSPQRRSDIAKLAANKRWHGTTEGR